MRFPLAEHHPLDKGTYPEGPARMLSAGGRIILAVGSYRARLQMYDCLIGLNRKATSACGESDAHGWGAGEDGP